MKFAYSYRLRFRDGATPGWGSHIVSASSTINRATFVRFVTIRSF